MKNNNNSSTDQVKIFKFLRNLGLVVGYAIISILIVLVVSSAFGEILNFNDNLSIGIPLLLALYFWSGFFLKDREKRAMKITGISFMIIALIFQALFLFSNYPSQIELLTTTVLLLLPLLGAGFIVFNRPSAPTLFIWSAIVILLTMGIA